MQVASFPFSNTFGNHKKGFDSNRSYERTKTSPTGIQMKTNYNNIISSVISQVMSSDVSEEAECILTLLIHNSSRGVRDVVYEEHSAQVHQIK